MLIDKARTSPAFVKLAETNKYFTCYFIEIETGSMYCYNSSNDMGTLKRLSEKVGD